jgi:hypothetical protein
LKTPRGADKALIFVSGKALLCRRTGDALAKATIARGEKAMKDALKRVFRHALINRGNFFR